MKTVTPIKANKLAEAAALAPIIEIESTISKTNFQEIKTAILAGVKTIKLELKTDSDFADAEKNIKSLKTCEDALTAAKDAALAKAEEVQKLFAEIDETKEACRGPRLQLDKAVKAEKEKRKGEIIAAALDAIPATRSEFYRSRITNALKGKRTIKSWTDAAEKERVAITSEVENSLAIIAGFIAEHGDAIALDRIKLETMSAEALEIELQSRVDRLAAEAARKAAEEAQRKAEQEAAQARKEAEEAKAPPMPPKPSTMANTHQEEPPKVEPLPVKSIAPPDGDNTQREEWEAFKADFVAKMSEVKALRKALKHPANQERAWNLATELGQIFNRYA